MRARPHTLARTPPYVRAPNTQMAYNLGYVYAVLCQKQLTLQRHFECVCANKRTKQLSGRRILNIAASRYRKYQRCGMPNEHNCFASEWQWNINFFTASKVRYTMMSTNMSISMRVWSSSLFYIYAVIYEYIYHSSHVWRSFGTRIQEAILKYFLTLTPVFSRQCWDRTDFEEKLLSTWQ